MQLYVHIMHSESLLEGHLEVTDKFSGHDRALLKLISVVLL